MIGWSPGKSEPRVEIDRWEVRVPILRKAASSSMKPVSQESLLAATAFARQHSPHTELATRVRDSLPLVKMLRKVPPVLATKSHSTNHPKRCDGSSKAKYAAQDRAS